MNQNTLQQEGIARNSKSQPIINRWELRNFQSIQEFETFDLKPLTIFSGPNSSGKSTIIKSLLMVAQSLDSSAWEVPLVLNGKYTQLGDFDHILHHGSESPEIELCFRIKRQEREIDVQVLIKNEESMRVEKNTITIYPDPKKSDNDKGETWFELEHDPQILGNTENQEASQIVKEQIKHGLFNYKMIKPENIENHPEYEKAISASPSNFLPSRPLMQVESKIRDITEEFEQARLGILSLISRRKTIVEFDGDKELSREATLIFKKVADHIPLDHKYDDREHYWNTVNGIWEEEKTWTISRLKEYIKRHLIIEDRQIRSRVLNRGLIEDLTRRMSSALAELRDRHRITTETSLEIGEFPPRYGEVIQQIRQFFGNQIFYLGPLRDDPRTIYAIPTLPNQRNVGLKGEYTAAMLNVHRQLSIEYPLPPEEKNFDGEYKITYGELGDAVQVWLERMGLAENFKTEMISKVGYQLAVRPKGVKQDLDLMSLGVGVSQVLPTIVMALLAPEDSVLIFEQPEVHLHPKVQSVLGDFFLGIVGCGKQCILETHSEHLINRTRRRIAESEDTNILDQLQIYFVELQNGISQFRSVEPNEFGAIMDWPTNFFDEVEKESSAIVRAAMEKRRKSKQTA